MIGKIVIGKSFGGCVRYVVEKKDAILLHSDGLRMDKISGTIQDFNIQRMANPELSKAVGHISLNWSERDLHLLNPEKMLNMAMEYLKLMTIKDTQLLIVQHTDNHHPHLHIIYNRVDNNGKTISDQFQFKKNMAACKTITMSHGLFIASDKSQVNRKALKGTDREKYKVFDQVKRAKSISKNWNSFEQQLSKVGITLSFKYKGQTDVVQGISFRSGEFNFKGSELDRSLSFGKIDGYFNQHAAIQSATKTMETEVKSGYIETPSSNWSKEPSTKNLLDILLEPGCSPIVADPEPRPKKKKKKGEEQERNMGMRR
ncbi:hypothetical protein ACVWYG_001297 [Pedobacter sp. UYEF25]